MPTRADKNGNSVLHFNISPEHAKRCLDAGDDINFKNNKGETPLNRACYHDNFELVKFLIENGADKISVDWHTTDEIKCYLVRAGCPASDDLIKRYGTDEQKAKIIVSFDDAYKSFEETKMYISQGGDINKQNETGLTLLHHAINTSNLEWVKFLIENGANQKIKDNSGRVPARFATNRFEIYNLLKDSIDEPDNDGNTCMHIAAKNGIHARVIHLVAIGAKFNIKNNEGRTAYDNCSNKSLFKSFEETLNELVSDNKLIEAMISLSSRLPEDKKINFIKNFIGGL
jgi:ankyrin repeat protein